jgi:hypothetical protein
VTVAASQLIGVPLGALRWRPGFVFEGCRTVVFPGIFHGERLYLWIVRPIRFVVFLLVLQCGCWRACVLPHIIVVTAHLMCVA